MISPSARLRAQLDALADEIASFAFRVPSPERSHRQDLRDDLLWTIREYLIPRLGNLDSEIVTVIVGSTGSGKSTILNTLAQAPVSDPGAVRPTTTAPVIWCHEDRADEYRDGFLTGYGSGEAAERQVRVVAGTDPLLAGVTIIDAPDFDSVAEGHREMAEELLSVADLCVFVTSAQRYADAVPWEFLERARRRDLPIIFVVNRLPPEGGDEIVADYAELLKDRGIVTRDPGFLRIREQATLMEHGGLPAAAVAPMRAHLLELSDPEARRRVVAVATQGALNDVLGRCELLGAEVDAERQEVASLVSISRKVYETQLDEIDRALEAGTLIRAEVVRRWQEFLGTGELLKVLTESVGRLRRWARRVFGGEASIERIGVEARSEFLSSVLRRVDLAASHTAAAWEMDPVGKALLAEEGGTLWRHDPRSDDLAAGILEDWIVELGDLVAEQGGDKRRRAQLASFGVNAVALVALLAIFSQTGGITGGEIGVAAGAAAAQQKLLEHLFGTAAARSLVETGRHRLLEHVRAVFDADADRFIRAAESVAPGGTLGLKHAMALADEAAGTFYAS